MRQQRLISSGLGYYIILLLLLYLPILVLVIFSFNASTNLTFPLAGFTLKWYQALVDTPKLVEAVRNSLLLGLGSALLATILGTAAAIGVVRYEFPGKGIFLGISAMPLVIPYVVIGVALLIALGEAGIRLNLWTVGLAHVMISTPYALLIVASRLVGFDPNLEEAAMDLGCTYWQTLARVTLPICAPALVASFLTCFTLSFDEFAIAFFLAGTKTTLPIYLYSQLRFPGRLPIVVALASILVVASLTLVLISERLRRSGEIGTKKGVL